MVSTVFFSSTDDGRWGKTRDMPGPVTREVELCVGCGGKWADSGLGKARGWTYSTEIFYKQGKGELAVKRLAEEHKTPWVSASLLVVLGSLPSLLAARAGL